MGGRPAAAVSRGWAGGLPRATPCPNHLWAGCVCGWGQDGGSRSPQVRNGNCRAGRHGCQRPAAAAHTPVHRSLHGLQTSHSPALAPQAPGRGRRAWMVSQEALPAAAAPRTAVPEASGDGPQAAGLQQATVAGVSAAPAPAAPADAGCSMFAPTADPAPAAAGTMQPQSASAAPEQARPAAPTNAAAQVCRASMERYPVEPDSPAFNGRLALACAAVCTVCLCMFALPGQLGQGYPPM